MNNMMEILKEIRRANNLTQAELGNRAGYSRFQIAEWERGAHDPRINAVSNISEALGYELVLRPKR